MLYFIKRGMKNIVKKVGIEKASVKDLALFTRDKVGTHLGMILDKGKQNSIIVAITHSKSIGSEIKTFDCEFSSIEHQKPTPEIMNNLENVIKRVESRAFLTIVHNDTLKYKNQKILTKLVHKTGTLHDYEKELLKRKILFKNKIVYLSNEYNSEETHILYQTKTKTEAISIKNDTRIIELIGKEAYNENFKSLIDLPEEIGSNRMPISEILREKIEDEGIEGLMRIINKLI